MDCKKYFSKVVLFSTILTAAACSQPNTGSNSVQRSDGADCASHEITNSFIVEWRGEVPEEFSANKLTANSQFTRFQNISEKEVNEKVMRKYSHRIVRGEPEYRLEQAPAQVQSAHPADFVVNQTVTSNWGFADIEAEAAWSIMGDGTGIIVAVVDSGVETTHPALQGQIAINTHEIPNNQIDDDGNGLIDDYYGYDFGNKTGQLTDVVGHGTHVSGIIAARKDSSVTGVAPGAKILPVRFIDAQGKGSLGDALAGIDYAKARGAKVINASWGGPGCSSTLQNKLNTLSADGIIFANSAGNSTHDLSTLPEYPAAYTAPGKITVGSFDQNQVLSSFSNYGTPTDLVAPGGKIISTYIGGTTATLSGTSMASPFVAGVAAALWSGRPNATYDQIVAAINDSVINNNYPVRTRGKLSMKAAAQLLKSRLP